MFEPSATAREQASAIIENAIKKAYAAGALPSQDMPSFIVECPADPKNGDFAANAALAGAKLYSMPPRKIAEAIRDNAQLDKSSFERIEIAGPGFLNFYLSPSYFGGVIDGILREKENYGRTAWGRGKKYMVEFVSANPTGPMHLGNARGGAIGDCLASVLDFAGCEVMREFYVNDAGNQIEKFALSLEARYLALYKDGIEFPEDGYHGDDIIERAKGFAALHGDAYVQASEEARKKALVDYALPLNIEKMQHDLAAYRITYDVWFRESSLYADGLVDKIIGILKERNLTYEKDGALWYKATEFGGEKDEVLIRANGFPTYFAGDIAYHYNKFAVRGFDAVINVWGADHHGHVARLKGAMDAVGLDGSKLDIVLMQLVRLVRDGEQVRMSKRTGKAISLSDLLDEIPVDAARFFFNLREPSSHLEFDLGLAVKRDSDNPVYYVQYAHARICSIIKALESSGVDVSNCVKYDLSRCCEADELALIRKLASFPDEITSSAREYDPARITRYVVDAATLFHKFYTTCRVKCDCDELMYPRVALCLAARQVIRNCLSILKIDAPESM